MRCSVKLAASALALCLAAQPALAQQLFFFPAQGQTQDQQNRDMGECQAWAIQQSGFDPLAPAQRPAREPASGGVVGGAAVGALGGLAVGAIAGRPGRGAAMGAAGGGIIGGLRRSEQQRRDDANQRQFEQQQAAGRDAFNRAMSACMTGRGYTVG